MKNTRKVSKEARDLEERLLNTKRSRQIGHDSRYDTGYET